MKVTGKIAAAIMTAVLALSLTACGEDAENISGVKSAVQSTAAYSSSNAPESSSGTAESSTSSLTESISETDEEPEQEEIEKIPLTVEELDELFISPNSISFFNTYKENNRAFDYTVSIDDVEMLDFVLDSLVRIIETDDADDYEFIWGDVWDESFFYFKPETAERLIQEHFLPSFSINSLEYTSSPYWDKEKGEFKVFGYDFYRWEIPKENYYLCESGYAVGEYCYVNVVPLADYPGIRLMETRNLSFIKMSDITSEYFDIPRMQLKFKKYTFKYGENNEYDGYVYVLVGFEPVDERLEWVKTAENVYNTMKNDGIFQNGQPYSAGVMDGGLGKRIYLSSYSEMGSHRFTRSETIITYGIRDKDDVITVNRHNGGALNYMETDPQKVWGETYGGCTIEDKLKDEKYSYSFDVFEYPPDYTGSYFEDSPPTYKHNGKEISEDEYNSAELVRYFEGNENKIYTCSDGLNKITLGEYFEMCRIIAE